MIKREKRFEIRCTEKEMNRLKILAREYTGGNVSRYILHQALHATPTYLVPKRALLDPKK